MIALMITPISIMPSVEPITEVSSVTGVGVACRKLEDTPRFCTAETGW